MIRTLAVAVAVVVPVAVAAELIAEERNDESKDV